MRDVTVRVPLDKKASEAPPRMAGSRPSPPVHAPHSSPTLIGQGAPPPSLQDNVDFDSDKTHTRASEPKPGAPVLAWRGEEGAVTHAMASSMPSGAPPPDLDDLPTRAIQHRSEHPSGSSVTPGGVAIPPGALPGPIAIPYERDPLLDDDPFPREKKGKRWLIVLAAAVLVFCGGLVWIRISPEQVTSTPSVTVGASKPPKEEPTGDAKVEPTQAPSADAAPTPSGLPSADAPASAEPETTAAPSRPTGRPGTRPPRGEPKPPKTSEPAVEPPPKKPDEDLTSPYK